MKILQWLSSVDPEPNHRAAQNLRQIGTGDWLTGGKTYRDWFNAGSSFLWLYGLRMLLLLIFRSRSVFQEVCNFSIPQLSDTYLNSRLWKNDIVVSIFSSKH